MVISTSKKIPPARQLIKVLRNEFSHKYSYRLFGLGDEKTIIVQQSFFVGAQISRLENEVRIDAIAPSPSATLASVLLQQLANLFILFSPDKHKKLVNKLGRFMMYKYN